MRSFWIFFFLIGVSILSACHSVDRQKINSVEQSQNDLIKSVNKLTFDRIKYRIQRDLQYERGCRERGIEIEVCDVSNSLDIRFTAFDCKTSRLSEEELLNPNGLLMDFRKHGAVCDYHAELEWPDGAKDTLNVSNEKYEFGIVYSNELYIEHGWKKVRG